MNKGTTQRPLLYPAFDSPALANRYEIIFAGMMAVFVTFVILTNTVGVKLFTIYGRTLPVSIIWYPLTFLVTDIVSEMYGARRARFLVIMGFCMSVILLLFSLIGIALPVARFYPLQKDYTNIFGPIWRLLFGSMAAYLLAQLIDVRLFHFWKRQTKGKHLWLRNNGSTMLSQFVDSFTVNTVFLYKNPTVFNGNFADLMHIILGVYLIKVVIAALDTPLCYLGVWAVEKATGLKGREIDQ
ncbi:MAG: queuosine precursor transporter [bacterium]